MTFMNKLLTYLGFCPSKESAQGFRVRNNTISLKQGVVGLGFSLILILLVSNIYTGVMTVDAVLRLFSIIVFCVIMAILVGGLIVREMKRTTFTFDPWATGKRSFAMWFIMALILGATTGWFFISPTDGWVEIISEALAFSLMVMAVEVIGAEAYLRWRKDKE